MTLALIIFTAGTLFAMFKTYEPKERDWAVALQLLGIGLMVYASSRDK